MGKVGVRVFAELSSPLFPLLCPNTRYRYGRLLPTVVWSWLRGSTQTSLAFRIFALRKQEAMRIRGFVGSGSEEMGVVGGGGT